jgi:flagellum-specific peptidoglycan hydrolase FlgJ
MKTILLLLLTVCLSAIEVPQDPKIPGQNASRVEREAFAHALAKQFDAWQKANPCGYTIDALSASAQWMSESNWGKSGLSASAKNLGGIKGIGPKGTYSAKTKEVFNGKEVTITDGFRAYNSFTEFYVDYRKIANRMGVVGKSGKQFYQALINAKYATDPSYVSKVEQIYNQLNK